MRLVSRCAMAAALVAASLPATGADAQTTTRPRHGCYRVVGVDLLNIRARPFSTSAVIGTAARGEFLIKWRGWCTLRGYWCPVQKGGLRGHADKTYLRVAPCPPSMSAPG